MVGGFGDDHYFNSVTVTVTEGFDYHKLGNIDHQLS